MGRLEGRNVFLLHSLIFHALEYTKTAKQVFDVANSDFSQYYPLMEWRCRSWKASIVMDYEWYVTYWRCTCRPLIAKMLHLWAEYLLCYWLIVLYFPYERLILLSKFSTKRALASYIVRHVMKCTVGINIFQIIFLFS